MISFSIKEGLSDKKLGKKKNKEKSQKQKTTAKRYWHNSCYRKWTK